MKKRKEGDYIFSVVCSYNIYVIDYEIEAYAKRHKSSVANTALLIYN